MEHAFQKKYVVYLKFKYTWITCIIFDKSGHMQQFQEDFALISWLIGGGKNFRNGLGQGSANFIYKWPDGKYFRFIGPHKVSSCIFPLFLFLSNCKFENVVTHSSEVVYKRAVEWI